MQARKKEEVALVVATAGYPKVEGGHSPSEIREAYKELAYDSAQLLAIMLNPESNISPAEKIRAIDLATKHGLGQKVEVILANPDVLEVVGDVAARHMSPEVYRAFREDLEERLRDQ